MGCNVSKLNNSEVVYRCRKRKRMMSDAVKYRREFAAAHLAYIDILREVGHALPRYHADRQLSDLAATPPSSGQKAALNAEPASSKPPQQIYLKPPSSSSSKSPAEPPPLPSTPSQQAPPPSNSDAEASESAPITHKSSKSVVSNGSLSPIFEFLEPEGSGDVHVLSAPSSPIAGPSPYLLSPSSSPLNSDWDPFDLFSAVPFRSPNLTSRYLRDWDAASQTYDFGAVDGLPELEEDEDGPKKDVYEASSNATAGQAPQEANNATESSAKPEKKLVKGNAAKVLETIDEDPAEMGESPTVTLESSAVDATSKSQDESAPLTVKDPTGVRTDRVKQLSNCMEKISDAFARASNSGHEVSEMLETHALHPHAAQFLDFTDSFRFGNSISWRRPRKSVSSQQTNVDESDDDLDHDSHSFTLEKLYTWEKKLHKEVKVGEQLQIAHFRKSREFHNVESIGKDPDLIEQCRSDMKSLESQLKVAFRAIKSVSLRIQQVTAEELYPQLIELLRRLNTMWKAMLECHTAQKAVALEIVSIEKSGVKFVASDAHRNAAVELEAQLEMWQHCFDPWVAAQQRYVDTLLTWIRVCHMEPEPNAIIKNGDMPTSGKAPIYSLARNWHDSLLFLKENNNVVDAISKFVGSVNNVHFEESEELAEMRRAEMQSRSMDRRDQKRGVGREPVQEDKNASDDVQREDAVLASLQQHLPSIFEALTTFSSVACREYEKLHGGADTSNNEK